MELKIKKETAKKLYHESPSWFKEVLEETFGKEILRKIDFTDLKTFDDCCRACETTEEEFEKKLNSLPVSEQTKSFERMGILSSAINQGWEPNHFNTVEKKWFPIFKVLSSGFGFSTSYYSYDRTFPPVGSRLCFKDEARSDHAGKQFTKLFQEFITAKKVNQ
jgi:hypothetical protein